MAYIKLTVDCGNDIYTYKYHSQRYGIKTERGINEKPTSKQQKKINRRLSARKRQWTASCNFGEGDFYITFTYMRQLRPDDTSTAHKNMMSTLAKIRRKLKKENTPLMYMCTTERGSKGAVHHHLLIKNNFNIGLLCDLWKCGKIDLIPIRTGSMAALAGYFAKETEAEHVSKKREKETIHSASRNLKKPKIKKQIIKARTFTEIPLPKKDCYKIHEYNGFQSIAGYMYQEYIQTRVKPDSINHNQLRFEVF